MSASTSTTGSAATVLTQREGPVVWLTLNRPEAKNAVDFATLDALHAALDDAAGDEAVRVVVLTGAGGVFCAGGDVKDMVSRRGQPLAVRQRLDRLGKVVLLMAEMDKPVVAFLSGDAVGAGATLALACDVIYAVEGARMGIPFARVGLIPDTAGTWTLPRAVGMHKARELAFFGALPSVEEWAAWGAVAEVFDKAGAEGRVKERVAMLAAGPTRTFGMAKRAMLRASTSSLVDALDFEAFAQGICFTTQDHAEGVDAFVEKRKPEFRGR